MKLQSIPRCLIGIFILGIVTLQPGCGGGGSTCPAGAACGLSSGGNNSANTCGANAQQPAQVMYSIDPSNVGKILPFSVDANGNLSLMCDKSTSTAISNSVELAVSQNKFLYLFDATAAKIYAFSIAHGSSGALTPVTGQPFSISDSFQKTHHIVADPLGRFVFVTNFEGNTIDVFLINSTTGALTVAVNSPFIISGPSHLAVVPAGNFIYVPDSQTGVINILSVDSTGQLTRMLSSPFLIPQTNDAAEFALAHPNGKFLFTANFKSVSAYTIDPSTAALTFAPGSPNDTFTSHNVQPFMAALDSSGKFLYVPDQFSVGLLGYTVDPNTAALTLINGSPFSPGNIFDVIANPAGPQIYLQGDGGAINLFTINTTTGALTASPTPTTSFGNSNLVIANVQ